MLFTKTSNYLIIKTLKPCLKNAADINIYFSQFTPAGQDFGFYVNKNKDIAEEIYNYYKGYDPSKEALLWCDSSGHGKQGAPYLLKDIIADMEAAEAMVEALHEAITL